MVGAGDFHPAKSPELNLDENAFNRIRDLLYGYQDREGKARTKPTLRARIERAVRELDADKAWFTVTYTSLRQRYQAVIDGDGETIKY